MAQTDTKMQKNAKNIFYRFGFLPTNDTIMKCAPDVLELPFQCKKLQFYYVGNSES